MNNLSKMRILHIHPSLNCGGIEAMICNLANEMSLNNDVSVCSIFEPISENQYWFKLSPRITKLSVHKRKNGFSLKEIYKIYKLIRKGKYDVVHIHGYLVYYLLSIFLMKKKVKFIYTLHSDARMESNKWDKMIFPIKKFYFGKRWITPVTISPSSQESFKELYSCQSALILNGIPKPNIVLNHKPEIEQYKLSPNTMIFLHAARIDRAKNQEALCQSFSQLIKEGHDIVLLIAGTKNNRDIYENLKAYFCDRIQHIGELSNLQEWFKVVDGMPMPSLWEGLPVSLLEAMSVGCIPICSSVGGIPDVIVHGENGFLSKTSSCQDFTDTLRSFLKLSYESRRQVANNAKVTFEKSFSITITTQKYLSLYRNEFILT